MDAHRDATEFERLLMHARWLSDLARRLVRDPATADDLVQDTWHAALRRPNERVTSERGWLATLLSNSARARARGESARRERERSVAVSESIEGPDQLVERAEAQRNLLERVLELDEPYRSTLLARYAQGASSAEIARQTHVNESTVRTRLARAHEQLRGRIERQGGGLLVLAPLLSEPTPSPLAVAAGGAKGTTGTFGIGAVIVGLALKIGVVAAAGLCGWLAWRGFTPHAEPLASSPSTGPEIEDSALDPNPESLHGRVALSAPAPVPAAVETPPAKRAEPVSSVDETRLEITVLRDQVPALGVRVWVAPIKEWPILECLAVDVRTPASALVRDTDRFGLAAFTGLDPQAWKFRVGVGTGREPSAPARFITNDIFPGYPCEIRLGTATVSGKVYDALGRERAGVGVQVYSARPDVKHYYIAAHTLTNVRGEYRISDLAAGPYLVIMEPDGIFDGKGEVERIAVELQTGDAQQIDFGSSMPSPRWSGRALNAFQQPFRGGSICIVNEKNGHRITSLIADDGRFEFAFVPGSWKIYLDVAGSPHEDFVRGFPFGISELPAQDFYRDLVVPGARVRVSMIEPLEPSGKSMKERMNHQRVVGIRQKGHDYPAAFRSIGLRADGTRLIDGLEPGVWTLSVHPGTFEEGSTVDVTIGPDQAVVDVLVHWKSR